MEIGFEFLVSSFRFHVIPVHVGIAWSINSFSQAHSMFKSSVECWISYMGFRDESHSSDMLSPEEFNISFFIEGI